MIIYETTNAIDGMRYRGQHTCHAGCNKPCDYLGSGTELKAAIEKHGREHFTRRTLVTCRNKDELNLWEEKLVDDEFVTDPRTYNLKVGGKYASPTIDTRAKMSAAHAMRPPPSAETKAKLSAALQGNTRLRGKKLSPATRKRMSVAQKETQNRPEVKAKVVAFHTGRKRSAASRLKMSIAAKARVARNGGLWGRHLARG